MSTVGKMERKTFDSPALQRYMKAKATLAMLDPPQTEKTRAIYGSPGQISSAMLRTSFSFLIMSS